MAEAADIASRQVENVDASRQIDENHYDPWDMSDIMSNHMPSPVHFDDFYKDNFMEGTRDTDSEDEEDTADRVNKVAQQIESFAPFQRYHLGYKNSITHLNGYSTFEYQEEYLARMNEYRQPLEGARFQLQRNLGTSHLLDTPPFLKMRHGAIRALTRRSPRSQLVNKLCLGLQSADTWSMVIQDELDIPTRISLAENSFYVPNSVSQMQIWSDKNMLIGMTIRYGTGSLIELKRGLNQVCICSIARKGPTRRKMVQPGMEFLRLELEEEDHKLLDHEVRLHSDQGTRILEIRLVLKHQVPDERTPRTLEELCQQKVSRWPVRMILDEASRLEKLGKRYGQEGITRPHIHTPSVLFLGGNTAKSKFGTLISKIPLCKSLCKNEQNTIEHKTFLDITSRKAQMKTAEGPLCRPRQLHITLLYAGPTVLHSRIPGLTYQNLDTWNRGLLWKI
jgi:hypothetical protein